MQGDLGLIDGWDEVFSLEGVIDAWELWKELLDSDHFVNDVSNPEGSIKTDWWNPKGDLEDGAYLYCPEPVTGLQGLLNAREVADKIRKHEQDMAKLEAFKELLSSDPKAGLAMLKGMHNEDVIFTKEMNLDPNHPALLAQEFIRVSIEAIEKEIEENSEREAE